MSKKCYVVCQNSVSYDDNNYYFEGGHEINKAFSSAIKANEAIVKITNRVLFGEESDYNLKQSLEIFLQDLGPDLEQEKKLIDMIKTMNKEMSVKKTLIPASSLRFDNIRNILDDISDNGFCGFFDMKKMTEGMRDKFTEFFIEELDYSACFMQEINYD